MTQGRKPKLDRPRRLSVRIPSSILDEFEARTFDPVEGRIPYSARADIVSKLLRDYFRGQDGQKYHLLVSRVFQAPTPEQAHEELALLQNFWESVCEATEAREASKQEPHQDLDMSDLLS
jgi:hypothetical protein